MTINQIFIDMDGVLCDFISAAMALHGSQYDESTYPRNEWDIANVLGISDATFWRVIDEVGADFWRNLDPYAWTQELVETAKSIAPVALLSSPSKHPSCHYGKRQWVDKHLPGVELILCKSKHFLSAPGRLLIDDNDGNVAKWDERGGTSILFPQPWNSNHHAIAGRILPVLNWLNPPAPSLIAFAGVARAGKDEAAKALIADGYERCCFGDIIKLQVDSLCLRQLGFSAFTEDDEQKKQIRPLLEHWGDVNYDGIMDEFFADLPPRAVNTRLCRTREAIEWRNRGGLVVEIKRIGYGPTSNWERDRLNELREAGCIDATITNDGTIADLHAKVRDFANGMGACRELSEAAR